MFLDVALVPLVVLWAIGEERYLLSAVFGVAFTGVIDPGGPYGSRASRLAVFALLGALLTALGFGIGSSSWGWLVLAAFIVTLAAGLAVKFGLHRFVAAVLLNVWFFIAMAIGFSANQAQSSSHTWAQALAWLGGSALWIAVTFIAWWLRGRKDSPPTLPELPGEVTPRELTRPLIMFAVIRALVMAGTSVFAFGLDLQHADWVPIAAIVAMKPSLEQTTLVAEQRLAGALIGAAVAALFLLVAAGEHGARLITFEHALFIIVLVLIMHAMSIRFWNYALYCGAMAAAALIAVDLPHPSNYAAEGDRVLYTFCGVGVAVLVMFLANLLAGRSARTQPQPN